MAGVPVMPRQDGPRAAPPGGTCPAPLHGSYQPDEVSFLLTDLSAYSLELGLREREQAIANGRNYAEMLPIEFAPSSEYLALFDALLERSAALIAEHVGVLTELAFAARSGSPVLVSLARAGTPVGILMRRWGLFCGKGAVPHYSISIVRGRGIDTAALDHIVARHDPESILFVDGWTGKGAIAAELATALASYARAGGPSLPGELAVLADPGHCSTLFATRDDILVPSACLNSTVCGLVSRTVLNDDLIGPGMFHGAKVYRELAGADRSACFLDAISGHFGAVAGQVARRWPEAYAADRAVTCAGMRTVRRVQAEFGLPSRHLVKPGAGEATRVLLRRLPWRVLIRPDCREMLEHLLLLASERGVVVIDYPDMPYSCIGLISPEARRGQADA